MMVFFKICLFVRRATAQLKQEFNVIFYINTVTLVCVIYDLVKTLQGPSQKSYMLIQCNSKYDKNNMITCFFVNVM